MKTIQEYEIIKHGIEHSDYFQGCSISFTGFTDVGTGIGNSEFEALDDALNQLAQNDWDVGGHKLLNADTERASMVDVISPYHFHFDVDDRRESPWVHVSVRVR